MTKRFILAVTLALGVPSVSNAMTVTAVNGYADALALVDSATTTVLPGSWLGLGPLELNPGLSLTNVYRSPFEVASGLLDRDGDAFTGNEGYFTVGKSSAYTGTDNPATLSLGLTADTFSFLLGSPDGYNSLEFLFGDTVIASYDGSQYLPNAIEASFLTFKAADQSEWFDTVRFGSSTNAMEFSNIEISAVPLPATGLLLIAGLGGLGALRRKKKIITTSK